MILIINMILILNVDDTEVLLCIHELGSSVLYDFSLAGSVRILRLTFGEWKRPADVFHTGSTNRYGRIAKKIF